VNCGSFAVFFVHDLNIKNINILFLSFWIFFVLEKLIFIFANLKGYESCCLNHFWWVALGVG